MKKILSAVVALIMIMSSFTACTAASKHSEINEEPVHQHTEEDFDNVSVVSKQDWTGVCGECGRFFARSSEDLKYWIGEYDVCESCEPFLEAKEGDVTLESDANILENNRPVHMNFYDICNIAKDGLDVSSLTFYINELNSQPVPGSGIDGKPYIILLKECKLNENVELCDTFFKYEVEGITYLCTEDFSKIFRWNSDQLADGYLNVVRKDSGIEDIEDAEDFFIFIS